MSKEIISETVTIDKPSPLDTQSIESILKNEFGEVLRWAIIETAANSLKICITYEKA